MNNKLSLLNSKAANPRFFMIVVQRFKAFIKNTVAACRPSLYF
jgi:hypothetical protein